jgi:holo-[acyl-carrier protein] synthase
MIFGVGFDLVDLADFGRILERSGEPFLKRVYTEQEIEYCNSQPHSGQSYAVRFAAKEAAMKALGIAGEEGLQWRDFEVVIASSGEPRMVLRGKAATKARALSISRLLLSLSHSMSSAGAVAIAEALPRSAGSKPTSKKRAAPRTNRARS